MKCASFSIAYIGAKVAESSIFEDMDKRPSSNFNGKFMI